MRGLLSCPQTWPLPALHPHSHHPQPQETAPAALPGLISGEGSGFPRSPRGLALSLPDGSRASTGPREDQSVFCENRQEAKPAESSAGRGLAPGGRGTCLGPDPSHTPAPCPRGRRALGPGNQLSSHRDSPSPPRVVTHRCPWAASMPPNSGLQGNGVSPATAGLVSQLCSRRSRRTAHVALTLTRWPAVHAPGGLPVHPPSRTPTAKS